MEMEQDKLARILVYGGLSDHHLRSYFKLTFAVRQSERSAYLLRSYSDLVFVIG